MNGQELMLRESSQAGQVAQADNDGQVIAMWLHGRPHTTQRAYSYEVQGLLAAVGKPLVQITLGDLQGYFSTLATLAPASQARAIHATKSLFAFAKKIGYLTFNPGAPEIILASGTGIGKPFSLKGVSCTLNHGGHGPPYGLFCRVHAKVRYFML